MKHFTSLHDVTDLKALLQTAFALKKSPFAHAHLGKHKAMGLFFMNPSLRTRLSTQRAAMNLGLNTMTMDLTKDTWKLETKLGVTMDGEAAEHAKEAIAVMGQYCDLIGVRSFPQLKDQTEDYAEEVLGLFKQYAGVPVVSLESATLHPLQSLADLMTIEEYKRKPRPKVVLTWAAHPKALPQAVPNSFARWLGSADVELVITHPEGYELAPQFTQNATIEYDQNKALTGADFVYAKNWASYLHYGKILSHDRTWQITQQKMQLTDNAYFMHCLPVRRNVIVSDQVLDSPQSIVIEQARNRLFAAQAVLKTLLESANT